MTTHAGCDVLVTYGDSIGDLLSPPEVQADDEYLMLHVESDRFYNALDDIGLGYTGPFRALSGPHQEPRKQQALAKASPRTPGNVGCGHPVCHAGLLLSGRHQTELLKQPLQRLDPSTRLVPQLTVIGRGASADQVHLLATDKGARVHQPPYAFAAKLRSSLQPEDDRPIVDQTADTLGIDSLFAVDIRSWFIEELQLEIPVLNILGEQQLLPTELLLRMDPNDKSPTRKPNPQTDSSPKKAAPAERSRAKAQTAVENDGDRRSAATRAESGSKKAEAVTRPSVQWQVPVELSTAVGDVHDETFPGEDGGKIEGRYFGHNLYP
ncbi:hypothetical protein MCOR29_002341 [Pyricularia oryzae]|uniref:Carrier domain-containing protein n=1 Tax=Pyricularia grisea TaxID=148305 RepID=A0ABQ8NZU3_PYRGI|nr:hypothetical protein MCOR01_003428 [Pyricularia oryzae]KAI6304443.1 hypothetical protein MCOR33_000537 [Pyricularia grisea]KAI6329215.1 hypothetical protein MCOR29_002341 [Pyricularia oryzae]KAI6375632.1 hypothetical protein MCOR31_002138 [Pyricularia oryzae]KAI6395570.1 hypothetical protein MCOR23_007005 [Pyricularia oryzae]